MKPYVELTHRGQVGRLKELARAALREYDVAVRALQPLVHLENTTFKVTAADGLYVLRINRPNHRSLAEIESEMLWLAAITADTDLIVPAPRRNRSGALVTTASAPGVPEARHCVLFRWVDGRFARKRLSPRLLAGVGRFMAGLHNQAGEFAAPAGFQRNVLGLDGEMGQYLARSRSIDANIMPAETRAIFAKAAAKIKDHVAELGTGPGVYNLIHADLHHANYLFVDDVARAIDFDDCGWGHFAYDIAVTHWYLRRRPDATALYDAFMAGYRTVRPFAREHEAYVDTYSSARSLMMALYVAGRADNPRLREWAPRIIAGTAQELGAFIA